MLSPNVEFIHHGWAFTKSSLFRIQREASGSSEGENALAGGEEPPEQRARANQEASGGLGPSQGKSRTKTGRGR